MAGIDASCALSLKASAPEARIGAWESLIRHRDELVREGEMMDRRLKEIGDSRPDEAQNLRCGSMISTRQ